MSQETLFPTQLAEKYRPRRLRDFIGIPKVRAVMQNFVAAPFVSSWFFLGSSGLGKTSMALAVAEQIGAELHHIPSRNCDEATIDNTCLMCHYIPLNKGFHVVLADEADKMTPNAQLALLSKLDATAMPPNTIFFFTANSVEGLEDRFLSRCRILIFEPESMKDDLPDYLRKLCKLEYGRQLAYDYGKLATDSCWNVRDAIMNLEIELLAAPQSKSKRRARQR